jgi:ribose transport system substrate-binding protein
MRRWWAAGAAIVVCLALWAPVLAQDAEESEAGPSEVVAGPLTVGFAGFGSSYWFLDDMTQGAGQAAHAAGVKLLVTDAGWSGTYQATQVEDFIKQGVDAIIVATPWDPEPVVRAIQAAGDAGIPVITVDRALDGATSYVGTDNVAGSRLAGEYLFQTMGGSGKVIEIEGDPSWALGRTEGFAEALAAASGITLVGQKTGRDDSNLARLLTAELLEANPDVTGVFVHTDGMTPGVLQAVAESGLADAIKVVSFDAAPEVLPAIRDGTLAASVAQRPDLMGQQAVEVAVRAAAGEPVEAFIPVETTLVTRDSVDQFTSG